VEGASVPVYQPANDVEAIARSVTLSTDLSEIDRPGPVEYVVEEGDSIFGIARSFDISPESLLWANYNTLNDDAHNIYIGTKLIIPPGTQAGKVFKLHSKGVPRLRASGRGDQLVITNVSIPTQLTVEQRELFEKLAASLGTEVRPQEKGFWDFLKDVING